MTLARALSLIRSGCGNKPRFSAEAMVDAYNQGVEDAAKSSRETYNRGGMYSLTDYRDYVASDIRLLKKEG